MQNSLSSELKQMLALARKTEREVAYLGGIDPSYVRKLVDGEKVNVSTEALMRLWIGIIFDPEIIKADLSMEHGLARLTEAAAMTAAALKVRGSLSR